MDNFSEFDDKFSIAAKKTLNQTIPIYIYTISYIIPIYIYTAYINPEKISASFPFHIAVSDLPLVPFAASLLISKRRSSSGRPARLWHFCSRSIILGARKTDVDWNKTCGKHDAIIYQYLSIKIYHYL